MCMCRGMCMLLGDPPGGGPPNVLQAGQNTLWVSGTPFSDDGERPHVIANAVPWAACLLEVRMADQPNSGGPAQSWEALVALPDLETDLHAPPLQRTKLI